MNESLTLLVFTRNLFLGLYPLSLVNLYYFYGFNYICTSMTPQSLCPMLSCWSPDPLMNAYWTTAFESPTGNSNSPCLKWNSLTSSKFIHHIHTKNKTFPKTFVLPSYFTSFSNSWNEWSIHPQRVSNYSTLFKCSFHPDQDSESILTEVSSRDHLILSTVLWTPTPQPHSSTTISFA